MSFKHTKFQKVDNNNTWHPARYLNAFISTYINDIYSPQNVVIVYLGW